jgi:hypothetical protein
MLWVAGFLSKSEKAFTFSPRTTGHGPRPKFAELAAETEAAVQQEHSNYLAPEF